jgi:hypothetical protein
MAANRTTNSDMRSTDIAQIKLQPFWIFNVMEISNTIFWELSEYERIKVHNGISFLLIPVPDSYLKYTVNK